MLENESYRQTDSGMITHHMLAGGHNTLIMRTVQDEAVGLTEMTWITFLHWNFEEKMSIDLTCSNH